MTPLTENWLPCLLQDCHEHVTILVVFTPYTESHVMVYIIGLPPPNTHTLSSTLLLLSTLLKYKTNQEPQVKGTLV